MKKLYCETSYGSLNKYGEELCGDKVEIVRTSEDDTIIVLADGLGSGVKANILASLTSKIVSTMLIEGSEIEDVIETISSTLPVCSERQIAYSTFTFLRITPNGEAHIVEFDNPEVIILRNGKSIKLNREKKVIFDKVISESNIQLKAEDQCIVFSDGAVHAGVGKLLNLGWQHPNIVAYLENSYKKDSTAFFTQSLLLNACNGLYMDCPGDDTTIAVCKLKIPTNACVMVGPPVNSDEDEDIVNELINFDGYKIICGGTTSQIVSRISKREIKTIFNYVVPDVPPIAKIDGIDLVTEGVITLGKVLENIKNHGTNRSLESTSKDGATLLSNMLIEKFTGIKFIVGRALNPAHQNPNLPINLSIKLRLVEEIAENLKKLNKDVSVEYH